MLGWPGGNRFGRASALERVWGSKIFIINIDAQDAQDKQDESFLHKKATRAMIRCGLADAQDYKTRDS